MHPPFESEIVYIMTGAYVPWLLEGWPFLLMAALFFAAKLSGGRQLKRIQEEQRRHSHETGRQAMNEQRQRRRRHHTSISSNARETVIMKSPRVPLDPKVIKTLKFYRDGQRGGTRTVAHQFGVSFATLRAVMASTFRR